MVEWWQDITRSILWKGPTCPMKEFIVGTNDAGQRLDRWLAKTLPLLPPAGPEVHPSQAGQAQRQGGKAGRASGPGDLLQLYINDEFFQTPTPENAFLSLYQPKLTILYEDEHILLVDKRPRPGGPPRRDGAGQHTHHPHPGLPLPEKGGPPTRGGPLPPPCATVLTGTPGASSSPPKRRRDFG